MQKKVVIIGGGFAGINLAEKLGGHPGFLVTLVDRNNYNFFPPLIYQVATAFLDAPSISYPFRKLFRNKHNIRFRLGELKQVVAEVQKVVLSTGELDYDYLVFATGAETNYFGMKNVERDAIPMKTLNDALSMRNKLLERLEKATTITDPEERKKWLNVVVAGGGPTGVEISGMFAEMRKSVIRKDYPELAGSQAEIYLVDGGDALLGPMSPQSQRDTYKALEKLGVKIKLNTHVSDFTDGQVILGNGEVIPARILIWAAGVTAMVFEGMPKESYGRGKRLLVDAFNKVQHVSNIFAIGDTCLDVSDERYPNGHPQVAQTAIQQGKNLARNLVAMEKGQPLKPFRYKDKGSMAIIGRNKAVADLPSPKLHFKGFIAWAMWLFIHLVSLINYRNRLRTLYNWMVAYFTNDQSLRMIIRPAVPDKAVLPEKELAAK